MRIRLNPWLAVIVIAAAVLGITAAIDFYRHRLVRSDSDLFRFLPTADATTFYANVAAMRHAGVLQLLAGTKPAEEPAYREFVGRTGFDYTRDLDALAGSTNATETFCLVRGRFDWSKLRAYAARCHDHVCEVPASGPNRWISFTEIQPDVMGLALGSSPSAASFLRTRHSPARSLPQAPIWISLSHALLSSPTELPIAARLFAISLQSAQSVVLSLAPNSGSDAPFKLTLDAACPNASTADTIRTQLELDTKMLQLGLARAHIQANPGDVTGLLTAGSFQVVDSRVLATWPIHKQLLNALQ